MPGAPLNMPDLKYAKLKECREIGLRAATQALIVLFEEQQLITNIVGLDETVVIDSDDDDGDVQEDVPSNAEMRHCLRRLHAGLENRGFKHLSEYIRLSSRISDMLRENFTQKPIEDFFKQ